MLPFVRPASFSRRETKSLPNFPPRTFSCMPEMSTGTHLIAMGEPISRLRRLWTIYGRSGIGQGVARHTQSPNPIYSFFPRLICTIARLLSLAPDPQNRADGGVARRATERGRRAGAAAKLAELVAQLATSSS